MPFLSPAWLLGLLGAGLPVFVHLLKRHKTDPLPFSSLMFFEQRTQSSVKHRRLQYLMLLAMRLAIVILLALAFANPYRKRQITAAAGEKIVLVAVDSSFSMRTGPALANAKAEAHRILRSRGAGVKAQVLALGSNVSVLTGPETDPGILRAAVESIQPGDGRAPLGEFTRAVRSLSASQRARMEVHLISDLQRSALPEGFGDLQMPETVKLILHRVGTAAPNWAVENAVAPATVQDPKKARIEVTVAGYGTQEAVRRVTLMVNGRAAASRDVKIPAAGRATVEFTGLDFPFGFVKAEAVLEGGSDALPGDDRLRFAMERSDPRRVLFIHEPRDTRSPLFFRSALGAAASSQFALDAVTVDKAAEIAPDKFSFVVIADVLSLPATFEKRLEDFLRTGGAALIAVGPSSARRKKVPVTGDEIREGRSFARGGARFETLGEVDAAHPSIRRARNWEGLKVYYAARIDPGDGRVVARLSDRMPVLYEKRVGEGRALVLATGLDNVSNDLPVLPEFIPFVEQTAGYLAGLEERRSSASVGAALELRSARERSIAVDVIDPDGKRPLSLAEAASAQAFPVTREGFYELRRGSGRNEVVAVNADRRESDLTPMSEDAMALWAGDGGGERPVAAGAPGVEKVEETISYWWYVMMGLLAVALTESWLASRYLGVEQEAA
jgi:hypothetical protein